MTTFRAAYRSCFWGVALCLTVFVAPVAPSRAQTLYASSETNNQIFAINTVTGQGSVVLSNTSGLLASPEGLAYYAPTGDLYIANAGTTTVGGATGSIVQYNTRTGATTVFAMGNTTLDSPQGLAFDAAGNLFATGYNSGTIVEFARTGGTLSTTATTFATGLSSPYYLAFDSAGALFVANPGAATAEVRRYTAPNTFTIFEAGATTASGTLDGPVGLAFGGSSLYVSDALNNNIAGFAGASGDAGTRTMADVTLPISGATLNAPQALAYNGISNSLYAANFGNNNIVRINPTTGAADVLFSGINGPTGLVFAADTPEPPAALLALSGMGSAGLVSLAARRRKRRVTTTA